MHKKLMSIFGGKQISYFCKYQPKGISSTTAKHGRTAKQVQPTIETKFIFVNI